MTTTDPATHTARDELNLDFERRARVGLDEAIFCAGKRVEHLVEILDQAAAKGARFLLTRLAPEQFEALPARHRDALDHDPVSRTAWFGAPEPSRGAARVAVICAGTSDVPILRECARTLAWYGEAPTEIRDVGVAGLWRLQARMAELQAMPVVIVIAGMDAALPTVVGGLVPGVVIGCPSSVGYGVATGGTTALNAMLASCAQGLLVTNIDNGFGAACAALRVLRATRGARPD